MEDVKILKKKLMNWKRLALARGRILAAYRVGLAPSGQALDEALAARDKLRDLGEDKA